MRIFGFIFSYYCFCGIFPVSNALNILAVLPNGGKIDLMFYNRLIQNLLSNNNALTAITQNALGIEQNPQYKEIIFGDDEQTDEPFIDMSQIPSKFDSMMAKARYPFRFTDEGLKSCEKMFSNSDVQNFLNLTIKFDVMLLETFNAECALAFADKFKSPLVTISSGSLQPWDYTRFRDHFLSPHYLGHGSNKNFSERVAILVDTIWSNAVYMYRLSESQKVVEKYLPQGLTSLHDLRRRTSLHLVNSHFSMTLPKVQVPAIIEVGGMHIEPNNPLPQDLQEFFAKFAFIAYVSMGTMIKGHTFPEIQREFIIDACRYFRLGILWKWDDDYYEDLPGNMMVRKWFPQRDILAQRKTIIFVSHGGLLSVIEALNYGVPMIAIPQFGDQFANARALESIGLGVTIDLEKHNRLDIFYAFVKLCTAKHQDVWKKRQKLFQDRPMPPLDTAVYWIEHVARHKGAPHLKTAAVDLPLYQYFLLDTWIILSFFILGFPLSLFFIYELICYKFFKKPIQNTRKIKKK